MMAANHLLNHNYGLSIGNQMDVFCHLLTDDMAVLFPMGVLLIKKNDLKYCFISNINIFYIDTLFNDRNSFSYIYISLHQRKGQWLWLLCFKLPNVKFN